MAVGPSSQRIRVIVAAGALVARQLTRDLASDPNLQIAAASSVGELFDQLTLHRPAVVLLDTQFVEEKTSLMVQGLAQQRHLPVVLRAGETEPADLLLDALENGALAIATKPAKIDGSAELTPKLIWTLHAAADASIGNLIAPVEFAKASGSPSSSILALGAGMGGLPALGGVLTQLPADAPATVAITPLPGFLTAAWCDRMALRCGIRVKHAADGDIVRPGQALIAPGHSHLLVRRSPVGWTVCVKDGPAIFHQKPSLELLFRSLAETTGSDTVAALFSGAGVDGVTGLLSLKRSGAAALIQSPQSCVCSDLPGRAQRCGSADIAVPANQIAQKLMEIAGQRQLPRAA